MTTILKNAGIRPLPNTATQRTLLDVGCGEGYALAYFKEQGFSVKGLDFSAAGVSSKNPGCTSELVVGDVFQLLESEIASNVKYDVVWLQNVLEHVLDPVGLMSNLLKIISPTGIAIVTVPNDCSTVQAEALAKGHIKRSFWLAPPEHLSYFDYTSLSRIAEETGWKIADIVGDFPIDWFLFHPGSNYVMDARVGKSAHKARVQLENLIATKNTDDVLNFWRSLARVGMGRDLTMFVTPAKA